MKLYVNCEDVDGYIRDACLFRKKINIWDTMGATIKYMNDTILSYSLNATMPYEGYFVGFNGTKGRRLDARVYHSQPWEEKKLADFRFSPLFGKSKTWSIGESEDDVSGGHWGSDDKMQDLLFRGKPRPDGTGCRQPSRCNVRADRSGCSPQYRAAAWN